MRSMSHTPRDMRQAPEQLSARWVSAVRSCSLQQGREQEEEEGREHASEGQLCCRR